MTGAPSGMCLFYVLTCIVLRGFKSLSNPLELMRICKISATDIMTQNKYICILLFFLESTGAVDMNSKFGKSTIVKKQRKDGDFPWHIVIFFNGG